MTQTILIATRSAGKQREIRDLVAGLPHQFVFPDDIGLSERPEEAGIETASTFEGNALKKAEYFARLSRLPTAAEDSGLEVHSLGGQPGVRSRRFSLVEGPGQDEANNAELLRRLAGAERSRRAARYQSVVVFISSRGVPYTFTGSCHGHVVTEPRGKGGFGYDPVFFSDEIGKTFGEADAEEKHAVSHRGRSFRAFIDWVMAHEI